MRTTFRFRHLPWSDELVHHVGVRSERLERVAWRPTSLEVTIVAERHGGRVDLLARTADFTVVAHAESENFFTAIDEAIDRLFRQLSRKKGRIQSRLVHANTHEGKLEQAEELMAQEGVLRGDDDGGFGQTG